MTVVHSLINTDLSCCVNSSNHCWSIFMWVWISFEYVTHKICDPLILNQTICKWFSAFSISRTAVDFEAKSCSTDFSTKHSLSRRNEKRRKIDQMSRDEESVREGCQVEGICKAALWSEQVNFSCCGLQGPEQSMLWLAAASRESTCCLGPPGRFHVDSLHKLLPYKWITPWCVKETTNSPKGINLHTYFLFPS